MPLHNDMMMKGWSEAYWREGDDCEGITAFSRNGQVAENYMNYDADPWGKSTLIWKCSSDGLSSDGDGGWNSGTTYPGGNLQDNLYRWSVWMKREAVVGSTGHMYLGLYAVNSGGTRAVKYLNSATTSTNFYFHVQQGWLDTNHPVGTWCLYVGHCWPSGTTHTGYIKHPNTGVWKMDGTLVDSRPSSKDCAFNCTITGLRHRTYQYYADSNAGNEVWWSYPRVDLCDGSEPTLQQLLRNGASRVFSTNWGNFRTT